MPFKITAPIDFDISDLKDRVKEKTKNGKLSGVDAKELVLSKVSTSLWLLPSSHSEHPCSLTHRCP